MARLYKQHILFLFNSKQKGKIHPTSSNKNMMNRSLALRNQTCTNITETNVPNNLKKRNESVEGDNPLLTAMKEAIECLTKCYQSIETEPNYHISFGRNRDGAACKRKIGRFPTKRSLHFSEKELFYFRTSS